MKEYLIGRILDCPPSNESKLGNTVLSFTFRCIQQWDFGKALDYEGILVKCAAKM